MMKDYKLKNLLAVLIALFSISVKGQILTPFSGTNSIPSGAAVTLCTHAGCGVSYGNGAGGMTVIYPGDCIGISIDGPYDTESCCDDIFIYDGVGNGGTLLQSYAGQGVVNFTAAVGQTITVEFVSDGSVVGAGYEFTVGSGAFIDVNNNVTSYTICSGESLNLVASGADTYAWSSGELTNNAVVAPMSATVYTVTGINNLFPTCPLETTVSVEVNETPTVNISGDTIRCGNSQPVSLTVNGFADSYLWSEGSTGNNILVNPLTATVYSVIATNANGCSDTEIFTVIYSPLPSISIYAPTTTVCAGTSLNLFATGADTYNWSTSQSGALVTVTPQNTVVYSVIGQNSYGCTATGSQAITVNPLPNVSATASESQICTRESITLTGNGAATYTWIASSLYLSGQQVTASPLVSTTYTVIGSTAQGCSKSNIVSVIVDPCTGVQEAKSDLSTLVYPNPTVGEFTVEFANTDAKKIEIADLSGRVIFVQTTNDSHVKFDLNGFAAGIYYVKATSSNSTDVVKVVKQ